jgi:TonB-linked SusC/RagA family outer membrane protein
MKSNNIINISMSLAIASLFAFSGAAKAQQASDSLVNVAFGKTSKTDLMGGVSEVNVTKLMGKDYHSYSLDGLQSLIGGYNGNIWGQAPLILVDGVPRDASNINATEVESITVLKGGSAVVLYGSKGAKGVVLITTKRGRAQRLTIDARANTGLYIAKRYPNYLGASEYMTLYNEACANDGISAKYSADDINNTALHNNIYKYPDMDLYSHDYLRKAYNRTDATMEITGGNDNTKYYANFGMQYNSSFIKYADKKNDNNLTFNIRANIDTRITSWLSAYINAGVKINNNYSDRGDYWNAAATLRPNWYSPLIPIDMVDPNNSDLKTIIGDSNNIIDGKYLIGGSSTDQSTVFGDMLAAGYVKDKNRNFLFDVGINADLSMLLKGLSFKTAFSVDYWDYYSEAWKEGYAVYQPTWSNVNGTDVITGLTKYGEDTNSTNEYVGSSSYSQTMTFRGQFDYNNTFNKYHNISASLIGWGYQVQNSKDSDHDGSSYHRVSNLNLGLRVGYNYNHTYYAEFASAMVHSAKLPDGNRNAISPSITLGWRISQESWFKKAISFVDDAKINASYSVLNQDIDISDYYMYKGYYNQKGGWYQWEDSSQGGNCNTSTRGENLDLGYIKRKEWRIGLEASFLNKLITIDANYFNQLTDGLLTTGSSTIYPSYFSGNGSFLPYMNYNQDTRKGFDFEVDFNKKIGQVEATLGFTGQVLKTNAKRRDEVYSDDYQYRAGRPLDTQWGYVCEGFFKDDADIAGHAKQTFGDVKPGDLKYKDVNGDGTIDSKDQVNLGKTGSSAAPFIYGMNLTLKWKQFTLFTSATGQSGAIGIKNSSYYWVKGSGKYSEIVRGRWTPETADIATYPRLTTTDNSNNFQSSTFWRYSTNRFDLQRVQLTYDLPSKLFTNKVISAMSVYFLGESLLTISSNRDLMETNIGSSPQSRFYNIGVKVTF